MIPVDPNNLSRGDVVYVREWKNKGTGQEPRAHYREARVHEAKSTVLFVKYQDLKQKGTKSVHRVRPSDVFTEGEINREVTIHTTTTLKETLAETHFIDVQATRVESVDSEDDVDPIFGEPSSKVVPIKKAAPVDVSDFKAWIEMGKSFARIPERIQTLKDERQLLKNEIRQLMGKLHAVEEEATNLETQYKEMQALLKSNFLEKGP